MLQNFTLLRATIIKDQRLRSVKSVLLWVRRNYSSNQNDFAVISFYKFKQLNNPRSLVELVRSHLEQIDAKGRIYVNKVGINAQMCLPSEHQKQTEIFFCDNICENIDFKTQFSDFQVFNRLRIRHGKLLEGLDENFDSKSCGDQLTAREWNLMMENKDDNTVLLDVRNKYEWEIGHFKDSVKPEFRTFNEFLNYAEKISNTINKDKKIMMYCTGGIRCELFSSVLKNKGFENVYQLKGGILEYGAQSETNQWRGKLFVFDDRLVVPISENTGSEDEIISKCCHCGAPADTCYNCNNISCNNVFTACVDCAFKFSASCSEACCEASGKKLDKFLRRNKSQLNYKNTVGRGKHFRDIAKQFGVTIH